MVFLLEDIAKIEEERGIKEGLTNIYETPQGIEDIFKDIDAAKKVMGMIRSLIEPYCDFSRHYVWGESAIGVHGVFTDAFLNAWMWGNKMTPGEKITTTIKYGIFGSVIYVEDGGEGFDYRAQISKLQSGEKHNYRHHGGGMRKFNEPHLLVAYHGSGNLVSIATPVFTLDDVRQFLRRKQ